MTIAAIMQPTYLPWLGYFDLMDTVDTFILLDTVDFSYQSWQHRNRIRTAQGLQILTVPVARATRHGRIVDVALGGEFAKSHARSLEVAYSRAPSFDATYEPVAALLRSGERSGRLVDVTEPLIRHLASTLGVTPRIEVASEVGVAGERSERLVGLCRAVGATTYLSPRGAVEYLNEDAVVFSDAGIDVLIQTFEHPTYPQRFEPFLPYASAIDALFMLGPDALATIRSGRRPPEPLLAS